MWTCIVPPLKADQSKTLRYGDMSVNLFLGGQFSCYCCCLSSHSWWLWSFDLIDSLHVGEGEKGGGRGAITCNTHTRRQETDHNR